MTPEGGVRRVWTITADGKFYSQYILTPHKVTEKPESIKPTSALSLPALISELSAIATFEEAPGKEPVIADSISGDRLARLRALLAEATQRVYGRAVEE